MEGETLVVLTKEVMEKFHTRFKFVQHVCTKCGKNLWGDVPFIDEHGNLVIKMRSMICNECAGDELVSKE